MKKTKDITYYRNMLHKENIILLIISVIFIIVNFLYISKGIEKAIPIFLKSILFLIFSILIISNKKENKKFIGNLNIIISSLMIITSVDGSLFSVMYFLLGIFIIMHSILYLKQLKQSREQSDSVRIESKYKYLPLISFFITIILSILGIIFNQPLILLGISWCSISIFIINIFEIILCIILNRKNIKTSLNYILLVISIIITLLNILFLKDGIRLYQLEKNYNNSEDYVIDIIEQIEDDIIFNAMNIKNQKLFNIQQGKNIIQLDDYLKKTNYENFNLKNLEKEGYKCVGYLSLIINNTVNYEKYSEIINDEYYLNLNFQYNVDKYFEEAKTYIKCNGKYNYQTKNFDESNIKSY